MTYILPVVCRPALPKSLKQNGSMKTFSEFVEVEGEAL